MTNVTANTRRSLARRFNDALRVKPKAKKQKPAICRCRRDNICHSCKGSMNRD